jgi:S1-C subfamily serine protease
MEVDSSLADGSNICSAAQTNALAENPQQFESREANLQHERAMALDIQVPDVDNDLLARDFATFVFGGVETYPHRDFIHFDFGPNRQSLALRPAIPSHVRSGSGFVVNREGYVVTNAHVAADCRLLKITHDGKEITVKRVVAIDRKTDLAILSVDEHWETAPVFSGSRMQTGDSIFALGFPLRGILSPEPIITMGSSTPWQECEAMLPNSKSRLRFSQETAVGRCSTSRGR